jgi:hypothetical protein
MYDVPLCFAHMNTLSVEKMLLDMIIIDPYMFKSLEIKPDPVIGDFHRIRQTPAATQGAMDGNPVFIDRQINQNQTVFGLKSRNLGV